ncbi:hypothetical protein B0H10DRAFT_1944044 [Mycena sp. CBHHK59/15]|nr:hypothetical protein B0H10DRAFT_1944044 [Mycena sp. CBHHK59/15]
MWTALASIGLDDRDRVHYGSSLNTSTSTPNTSTLKGVPDTSGLDPRLWSRDVSVQTGDPNTYNRAHWLSHMTGQLTPAAVAAFGGLPGFGNGPAVAAFGGLPGFGNGHPPTTDTTSCYTHTLAASDAKVHGRLTFREQSRYSKCGYFGSQGALAIYFCIARKESIVWGLRWMSQPPTGPIALSWNIASFDLLLPVADGTPVRYQNNPGWRMQSAWQTLLKIRERCPEAWDASRSMIWKEFPEFKWFSALDKSKYWEQPSQLICIFVTPDNPPLDTNKRLVLDPQMLEKYIADCAAGRQISDEGGGGNDVLINVEMVLGQHENCLQLTSAQRQQLNRPAGARVPAYIELWQEEEENEEESTH